MNFGTRIAADENGARFSLWRGSRVSLRVCLVAALLATSGVSCRKDNPVVPPPEPGHTPITFRATFISTRWCRLEWSNDSTAVSHRYLLLRDGRETLFSDTLPADTARMVLQDMTLMPGTGYSYAVYRIVNGTRWDSARVAVRTLDTTKLDYTWSVLRIGRPGSTFAGIWAVSASSIWVCGLIDSGLNSTDIVHYVDGKPNRYYVEGGNPTWVGCYGTSDTSVYFAGLASIAHYDGQRFLVWSWVDSIRLPPEPGGGQMLSIWATANDKEVFAGGSSGRIIHRRSDRTWEDQASGTTLPITSMIGFSASDVYATGAGPTTGVLLHYDGTAWTVVVKGDPNPPDSTYLLGPFNCVSGSSGDSLVLVGKTVYHRCGNWWQERKPKVPWQLTFMEGVEAREWNNVFVTGELGEILKWNGERWTMITDYLDYGGDLFLNGVLSIDGEVFIVGGDRNNAVLIHGK